jgi:hypothetical protein
MSSVLLTAFETCYRLPPLMVPGFRCTAWLVQVRRGKAARRVNLRLQRTGSAAYRVTAKQSKRMLRVGWVVD